MTDVAAAPGASPDIPGALPVGTRLGEFELRGVIGVGGFGIVYLAFDHALEREVAIKEFMPSSLAVRGGSAQVTPVSQSVTENFEAGLHSFVNEGRMLAHFDSPSLLKVHRFWEANGTAYIAMPLYRGRTLKEHRAAMPSPPDETTARALLMPLLAAVDLLHRESIFHRDIAPDNILVEAHNRPVLLDFGAARRVIGEKSQALTAILKPAYAPIEQYGEAASVKQGAWTDLYALGATMHFLLLGQAPPPSTTRAVQDDMQPLAERGAPGCSKGFLQAIDWMLAPRPSDRPQSVSALVDVLEGRAALPPLRTVPRELPPPPPPPAPAPAPPPPPAGGVARLVVPALALALLLGVAAWWLSSKPATPPLPTPIPTPTLPMERVVPLRTDAPVAIPPVASLPASQPAPRVAPAPPAAPEAKAPVEPAPKASATPVVAAPVSKPKPPPAARPSAAAASARRPEVASQTPRSDTSTPKSEPPSAPATLPAAPKPAAQPASVAPAGAPTATAQAASPRAPRAAKGPREECGRRVFIALLNCMNRECAKGDNHKLPECELYRPPS